MYPTTGWWPAPKKFCTRCLGPNDSQLQELCDTCREGDILAAWLQEHCAEDTEQRDRESEVNFARYGN